MEAFFLGLFGILIGLAFTFAGYQFFRVLLPLWGLFAGFAWGAEAISLGLGEGFLATLLGWGTGIAVGLVMAFLAYFVYEAAVAILAGFVGYWLAGSILLGIGFNANFFTMLIATAAGVALGILALYLRAPKGLLVILSAFGGATITIAGVLLMFGQVPVGIIGTGLMNNIIFQSFFWMSTWIILAAIGAVTQIQLSQTLTLDDSTYNTTMAGVKGGRSSLGEPTTGKKRTRISN